MDQIGSFVAEAIARRAKAALAEQQQAQAAQADPQAKVLAALQRRAQYGDATAQAILTRMQSVARAATPPAPPASAAVAAPAPPASGQVPAKVAEVVPVADSFELSTLPGLPTKILEAASLSRPALLGAFSGDGLLPAIVLAEALAKPVALRESGPGTSF